METDVRLTVFDLLGRKVKVLIDGNQAAGLNTITWDGKDDAGRDVASGIYFYHLDAGDISQTKKMSLLR